MRFRCEGISSLILAGILYVGCLLPVAAQNPTCPTRPVTDSSNACASTQFVQGAILATGITVGSTVINSGTNYGVLYNNAGVVGNTAAGTAGYFLGGNGAAAPTFQGFVQAGTGAATRTWQNKARDIVHAKDFGAVCDGVTTGVDAPAIQAAVDSLGTSGGLIYITGSCLMGTSTITVTSNVIFDGDGAGGGNATNTTLVFAASTNDAFKFGSLTTPIAGGGLRNLRIDTSARSGSSVLVRAIRAQNLLFENMLLSVWNGFDLYAVTHTVINNIYGFGKSSGASGTAFIKWYGDGTYQSDSLILFALDINMQGGGGDCVVVDSAAHTLTGTHVACINANYGYWAKNTSGDATKIPSFNKLFFFQKDLGDGASIRLEAGEQFEFHAPFASYSYNDDAVYIGSLVKGAKFFGGQIGRSSKSCAYVAGVEVEFHGVLADACNQFGTAAGTYPVYSIQNTAQKIKWYGGIAGAGAQFIANGGVVQTSYAIQVTGAPDDLMVSGTNLSGNLTGTVSIGSATNYNIDTAQLSNRGFDLNIVGRINSTTQTVGGTAIGWSAGILPRANGGTQTSTGAFVKTNIQVITASGTYTPTTGILYAIIECWGGGGGGGGGDGQTGQSGGGGGGGSGGYSRTNASAATIGASQSVTIGGGGAGGAAGNNNGTAGGNTSVGSLCIANGGSGGNGSAGTLAAGGLGGTAGTGTFTTTGYNGASTFGTVLTTVTGQGGAGANSPVGGGGVAPGTLASAVAGQNATGYAAGGSGAAISDSTNNAAGGNGAPGLVVITEFLNQ